MTVTNQKVNQMQLTTRKQLHEVKVGTTLFQINPYGRNALDQDLLKIHTLTVTKVTATNFTVCEDLLEEYRLHERNVFFRDLLSGCKYVYTDLLEAVIKLKEVRKGIHAEEVKAHHDSCYSLF